MRRTARNGPRLLLRYFAVPALALAAGACSPEPRTDAVGVSEAALSVNAVLNTQIGQSIEIDAIGGGPGDSNLYTGADPADGTASAQLPVGGPAAFIDWNDLGGDLSNHRLLDLNNAKGQDPTSFPRSNECVDTSSVLSKMDLTYVGSANNGTYGYFAVQRSNNNGDAGYYWLFTRKAPRSIPGQAPCKQTEERLLYDISGSADPNAPADVLLAGHFHPSGDPLLRVFRAKASRNDVTAVAAIDFSDATLWAQTNDSVLATVNTTPTAAGAFGTAGVIAAQNGVVEAEIFAEAAVPLTVFSRGSLCDVAFYGSVITRSSGSGGTQPDLKDLAGPALFNFGRLSAEAALTPSCAGQFGYAVTKVVNPDGTLAAQGSYSCLWSFDDGTTSSSCSGTRNATAGNHQASVQITINGCSPTTASAQAAVLQALKVNITPSSKGASCPSIGSDQVTYTAKVSGGSGSYGYSWNEAPGCTGASCLIDPSGAFCLDRTFSLTVSDADPLCPPATSETEHYTKVTTVTATDN